MNFNHYCNLHGSDKGDLLPNGNDYARWYDNWFAPVKNDVGWICEIGIDSGASLRAMYDYFPRANIIGLDVVDCISFNCERINTFILDQGREDLLVMFVEECVRKNIMFDIIIDDGSHDIAHQQMTVGKFFPLIKPGGVYIIEDLGTSYMSLGFTLYHQKQTQTKINNNTIKFLNQRPFSSLWMSETEMEYVNEHVDYVSIFDKKNEHLTYGKRIPCINNYPIRSITSIIKKKSRT